MKSSKSARDRILDAASELFYREGIRNVGIDRIVAHAGVAKMSLYNHFKSKDALVEEFLRREDRCWRQWFEATMERYHTMPEERLLVVFDCLKEWFESSTFRGCAFLNTIVELADPNHPAHQVAMEHNRLVYEYLLSLARATKSRDPESLARQILILMEGAIALAMMEQDAQVANQAKQAAALLVAASA